MTKFIQRDLQLQLDIFNLSLYGSFFEPVTEEHVLGAYAGKSIVILGNQFPYFQSGHRFAYELLDPTLACSLAKAGTNFLFSGQGQDPNAALSLTDWSSSVILLAYPQQAAAEAQAGSVHGKPFKGFIKALALCNAEKQVLHTHSFPCKSRLIKDANKAMSMDAKMADKMLKKHFP